MTNSPEFWAAFSAATSALTAVVSIHSFNRDSRIRRSGSISLSSANDYSGNVPQKYLVITNGGQSIARNTQLKLAKSKMNWKVEMIGSDQESNTHFQINLGDLSPNTSAKRRIHISFGDSQVSNFVGTATWSDYRRKHSEPFSCSFTIY